MGAVVVGRQKTVQVSVHRPHARPLFLLLLQSSALLLTEPRRHRSMEFYVDEKWKFSKKSRNNGSRRVPGAGAGAGAGGDPFLKRSSSMRDVQAIGRRGNGSGAVAAAGGCAPQPSFSSRCAGLVKEQRARFYIMRRCVTMLVCWKDCS
ncbi:hypothetical protein BS78_01G402600 [Paspalum vaginatum]|nr:hypothetical protein BS78_01G402600 [Paspalum vaginatum]